MFLLRCLFWLGLVFSQIAQLEGSSAASIAGDAASDAQGRISRQVAGQTAILAGKATEATERQCGGAPARCLALAAQAAAASARAVAPGRDSLTAADRAPAWRDARALRPGF
jgi:hypothetical protein